MNFEDWQLRVIEERVELSEKINKLADFIAPGGVFSVLPDRDQDLLRKQLKVMLEYSDILASRIGGWAR